MGKTSKFNYVLIGIMFRDDPDRIRFTFSGRTEYCPFFNES